MAAVLPVLILALSSVCLARPEYLDLIPNGASAGDPSTGLFCNHLGHIGCVAGAARNQFGLDFDAAGREWTKELCAKDSDGDGVTNGEEMGDPCCVWTADVKDTATLDGFRSEDLSHPGVKSEMNSAPKCAGKSEAGASSAPTTAATATAAAATAAAATSVKATAAAATSVKATAAATTSAKATAAKATAAATTSAKATAAATASAATASAATTSAATTSAATTSATATAAAASPDTGPGEDDDDVCFPASALVETPSGPVAMESLSIGDRVRVGDGSFSTVFMFTHKDSAARHGFVKISTAAGRAITATAGHYVLVGDGMVAAAGVRVGDVMTMGEGGQTQVVAVERVFGAGLYNPQTLDGRIVVNGLVASTYTKAVEPGLAHAALAPFRALYRAMEVGGSLDDGSPVGIREWFGGAISVA